jgi:hypothetical protein
VVDAFSAPDGSCLLVAVVADDPLPSQHRLLAFHWDSFDSNQEGIYSATLPSSNVGRVVTSFEGRDRIHVLSFSSDTKTIESTALRIQRRSTAFGFHADQTETGDDVVETINNCLVDCHVEVWSRFPVVPAVPRATLSSRGRASRQIIFVSPASMDQLIEHFAQTIELFKDETRKPVGKVLETISVVTSSDPPAMVVDAVPGSSFGLGGFIAELLCLIPIQ